MLVPCFVNASIIISMISCLLCAGAFFQSPVRGHALPAPMPPKTTAAPTAPPHKGTQGGHKGTHEGNESDARSLTVRGARWDGGRDQAGARGVMGRQEREGRDGAPGA